MGLFHMDIPEMIEGDLPSRAKRLVIEWAAMHQGDLRNMWDKQEFRKLPPLE